MLCRMKKEGHYYLKATSSLHSSEVKGEDQYIISQLHLFFHFQKALKRIMITDIEGAVESTTADVSAPSMDDQLLQRLMT